MNTLKQSVRSLINEGFAPFSFKELEDKDHEECMRLMKIITSQNPGFKYCTDHGTVSDNKTDRGIVRRNAIGGQDGKWLAQYRPSLKRELKQKLGQDLPEEIELWLEKSKWIYTKLLNFSREIMYEVDKEINDFNLFQKYVDVESDDIHMMRSAQYDISTKELPVADAHCDYSGITLAARQSHPGLWLQTKSGEMIEYKPKKDEIMVFWGRKAPTATNGLLRKVLHEVNVPEIGVQRDAGIFFGHFVDVAMS